MGSFRCYIGAHWVNKLSLAAMTLLLGLSAASVSAMSAPTGESVQRLETQPLMIRSARGKQSFFTVEVADETNEQRTGLMFRQSLGKNEGMIFIYEKPRMLGMWMKNTLISLDMVFVSEDGKVINVHQNAVPGSLESIRSFGLSTAVLEILGGRADALGIKTGDQVYHCHFGNFPCETSPPADIAQ